MQQRFLGDDHLDTLTVSATLGDVYTYEGKYALAEALLAGAFDVSRRAHGDTHLTTLQIVNNLALAYSNRQAITRKRSHSTRTSLRFGGAFLARSMPIR